MVSRMMTFSYCGEKSKFSIFPEHSNLTSLCLSTYRALQIVFQVLFTVMSDRVISSKAPTNFASCVNEETNLQIQSMSYIFALHKAIYTVHIHVKKFNF